MFTTDELEAAGQRAANHPVESVPDVAQIQREVIRRRQSKRLLVGASTATFVLFGIGGLLLASARNDQVQVITASPVVESEAIPADSNLAGQQAQTDSTEQPKSTDGGLLGQYGEDGEDGANGSAGEDGEEAAAAGGSGVASSSSIDDENDERGEVTNGYTTETSQADGKNGEGEEDGRYEDWDGDWEDFFGDAESGFVFPGDLDEWLEKFDDRERPLDGDWRDYDLWPFGFEGLDIDISVGQDAINGAEQAADRADDSLVSDGRTIWIERQTRGNERRHKVTVSTLVDDGWFVTATGPVDSEAMLLKLVSSYDGNWKDHLIPEDIDRFRDRDWLTWPPTEDDWDDWQDAREDWLKEQEELLKRSHDQAEESRKQAEEERKRVEEERKRIEEERSKGGDDDDDDD